MQLILSKKIGLFFCWAILGSCTGEVSRDTAVFENYLKASFGKRVPEEGQFVIVSSTACGTCKEHVYRLAQEGKTPFTFIFPRYFRKKFDVIPPSVWIDTTMRIDRLALHQRNIAKVKVINSQVLGVTVYDPRNIQAIAD